MQETKLEKFNVCDSGQYIRHIGKSECHKNVNIPPTMDKSIDKNRCVFLSIIASLGKSPAQEVWGDILNYHEKKKL